MFEVADAGRGSTLVAAQRTIRLTTFARAAPDRDLAADQVEFG